MTKKIVVVVMAVLASWTLARGSDYKDPFTGMEFVFVKGGCFQPFENSAFPKDHPGGKACVKDFYIGKYEVTQAQWVSLMAKNPSVFRDCGGDCPVEGVSWDEAEEYLAILGRKTGRDYRLPYEAEWEYAARSAGRNEKWSGTDNEAEIGEYAWYSANSGKRSHPVGGKRPNGLGIYDMTGNVGEWMEDRHTETYAPGRGGSWEYRVLRGGSWGDSPEGLRFVSRNVSRAIETELSLGFRAAFPADSLSK